MSGGGSAAGRAVITRSSIRRRLVAVLAGVSLLTLLLVGAVFYFFLGDYLVDRNIELLLDQALEAAEQVQGVEEALRVNVVEARAITAFLRADLQVLPPGAGIAVFKGSHLVSRAGTLPVKQEYLERMRTEAERLGAEGAASGVVGSLTSVKGRKAAVLMAVAPFEYSDGAGGMAVVTLARADAFSARTGVFRALFISGGIAIVLAILAGLGLGAWMTRPLRRLSAAAGRMAGGSYEQPIAGSYPGEVQELADSMEAMRREVRRSEESLRGFVGTAAHELRTPLTSIQGFSQALLDGTADTPEQQQRSAAAIYRESTRLRRLVEALLTLSRYDSREFRPTMTAVAVDALVAEEVERLVQVGLAEPGRIVVHARPGVRAVTDADMLRQVVANLLRNAVQYGATDPVTVEAAADGTDLTLVVSNGGEPLSAEDRARVFDRFYRGGSGRRVDGLGLGLALVREICDVLGGRVELVGVGPSTCFRVTLPSRPEEVGRTG
ncbi:MAG: HAMP domain-containing histidine kinase [Thermoleophilia bacterium]|nr:HAMP domain-containing histidine kinase [Thermoleophilia bacterium]